MGDYNQLPPPPALPRSNIPPQATYSPSLFLGYLVGAHYCQAQAFRAILGPGHVAVDGGANIGGYTQMMALAVGSAGEVTWAPLAFPFEFQRRALEIQQEYHPQNTC